MCVCDEKSVWNVFFGNELAEVGRTKRRGSGASHFSLLCCLPVFLLSPMLIWSSPEKTFCVTRVSLSHWNEGRKLGKKKWANLRESKLTWGSSRPFDTFVVVTFIRAFWPEGVRFHTCSLFLLLLLLPSTLVCVAFGGQQSGRERERGWPFFPPSRPYLFESLTGLFRAAVLPGWVQNLGRGKSRFPPHGANDATRIFQQLIWERKERESRRRTQKMEISNFITKELFNWFVIN